MTTEQNNSVDMDAVRAKLAGMTGKQYWRSLGELGDNPDFVQYLQDEVPQATRTANLHLDRRQFLTLASASLALAGLSGCRYQEQRKMVAYVKQPEEMVLGIPMLYATAAPSWGGTVVGVLAKSREGRPIKIEGNPDHPASLGATDAITQATLLGLYDPDRASNVLTGTEINSWNEFFGQARAKFAAQRGPQQGAGIRILTETITSPTFGLQMQSLLRQFPQAKWVQWEPTNRDSALEGARLAFGQPVNSVYRFDQAKRILSLDADFLLTMPGSVRYARDFSDGRRVREDTAEADLLRSYVVESTPTITGAASDHKLPLKTSQIEGFARLLAQRLGIAVGSGPTPTLDANGTKFLDALVKDLQANPGTSVVVPGDHQTPTLHVLAHAINDKLGAVGKTVIYTQPIQVKTDNQTNDIKTLTADINAGRVDTLIILGGNPVYNAPADLRFGEALLRVPFRAHLTTHNNETSLLCNWQLPEAHYLEAWSDGRAYDGTVSIVQPLILPLYDGKSALEVISGLIEQPRFGYDIVHDTYAQQAHLSGLRPFELAFPGGIPLPLEFSTNTEVAWGRALHDGLISDTRAAVANVALNPGAVAAPGYSALPSAGGLEISVRPDPHFMDGRYNNNGWLMELPRPFSRLSWNNAALMSPTTAEKLGIGQEDEVTLQTPTGKVTAPVWYQPGHPDDAVTVHMGWGRTRSGQIGNEIGFDAFTLIGTGDPYFSGVQVTKTGGKAGLCTTQHVQVMEGRDIIRVGTIAQFTKDERPYNRLGPEEENKREAAPGMPGEIKVNPVNPTAEQPNMYDNKEWEYGGFGAYNWGMSVDIQSCIGCNACVIACQSENNIPVVGKDQVIVGRIMHWIRIDTYYEAEPVTGITYGETPPLHNPGIYFQPVMCMHCEQAPCEPVCPVAATIHSHEGINMMVYNRCVGTKYCSNNCPYKVRRFNFLNYANHHDVPVKKLLANPEVTVRGRGVMEKCSFCQQRISFGRQKAKQEGRQLHDGEVLTACQQVCPTNAIVFGNITDANTQVAKLKKQPHNYGLLADLNTRPRVTYMARVRNPNPELEPVTGEARTENRNG